MRLPVHPGQPISPGLLGEPRGRFHRQPGDAHPALGAAHHLHVVQIPAGAEEPDSDPVGVGDPEPVDDHEARRGEHPVACARGFAVVAVAADLAALEALAHVRAHLLHARPAHANDRLVGVDPALRHPGDQRAVDQQEPAVGAHRAGRAVAPGLVGLGGPDHHPVSPAWPDDGVPQQQRRIERLDVPAPSVVDHHARQIRRRHALEVDGDARRAGDPGVSHDQELYVPGSQRALDGELHDDESRDAVRRHRRTVQGRLQNSVVGARPDQRQWGRRLRPPGVPAAGEEDGGGLVAGRRERLLQRREGSRPRAVTTGLGVRVDVDLAPLRGDRRQLVALVVHGTGSAEPSMADRGGRLELEAGPHGGLPFGRRG